MESVQRPAGKDKLLGKKTLKVQGFLEEFEIDDIKKKVDIIDLLESFGVKTNKVGKSFMGLCPFHEDHNPSLSVDREKGLFNCFGCGESGTVVDVVMKLKNIGFREAMDYLKGFQGVYISPKELKHEYHPSTLVAGEVEGGLKPVSTGPGDYIDLKAIQKHYHEKLYSNPAALEYLKKRGFKSPQLYEKFQIGYSDGSLLSKLGEKQREELKRIGILNEGILKEHFLNCLVFPVFDDNGNTVSFYGRSIKDESTDGERSRTIKHRYLKGPHKGVFNRKASKVYSDELILTESIIDALSLVEAGLENVQAIYGTNGFTEEHLEILKADRVKIVVLALDNDEAGKRAASSLKEKLIDNGFKVKVISPFNGKDWNEMLAAGVLSKEVLKTLMEQAAIFEKTEDPSTSSGTDKGGFRVKEEKGQYYFIYPDMVYRLSGVKEMFVNALKAVVKVEHGTDYFIDTVDFYLYRSRSNFSARLANQFGIEIKRAERDLLHILEYLEKQKEDKAAASEPKEKELTEEDRRAGLEFLQSPDLLEEVVRDMETLGYVGEDMNKKLIYLCATSRKMDNPISVMLVSESASGKSYLVDTVKKLIPESELMDITSLSDQALNYMKDLTNKFMVFGESVFNETVEHLIREMLSSKQLSRYVTLKDEKTGELVTKQYKKEVIVASVMSTTSRDMNPENASRYFLINADESKEQTKRIFEAQRQKYSLERHYAKSEQIPSIIAKHRAAQKLLKKVLIVNPLVPFMDFPDSLMRLRRDHDRFIDLMAVICFLRQYQKQVNTVIYEGRPLEYIECDDTDYITARDFAVNGILSSTLDDIPGPVKRFYEELRALLKAKAEESGLKVTEAEVQQREMRKRIDWLSMDKIKRYLRYLVQNEYIVLRVGGSRGQRFVYSLAADEPIESIDISMIPAIEEIKKRMSAAKVGQSGAKTGKD